MEEFLKVALIQTTLDSELAWNLTGSRKGAYKMDQAEAKRVWNEICAACSELIHLEESRKPHIIVLPELCVADIHQSLLSGLADGLGAIIISGLDYYMNSDNKIENNAGVYIPKNWPLGRGWSPRKCFYFGKRFFARRELEAIKNAGMVHQSCDKFYLLNAGDYGKIGVSICADFYDIERFAVYKHKIHHLFILAYNQDVKSFYFLAEAISRLVYCNVVICNTGHYGGSVCFSPYRHDYDRYVYKHEGKELFTTQVVKLPVAAFEEAQKGNDTKKLFKNPPPGYDD